MGDAQWERASTISLKNVMNMASGFAYTHNPSSHPIYDPRIDRFAAALAQPVVHKPGAKFNCSDADASITGAVVAALAGTDLHAYAKSALLEPLRMVNYDWWFRDAAGRLPGGWGLRMRPMDMLKLGQLYLQKGRWNCRKIFDEDYDSLAWSPGPSRDYGLHWWIARDADTRTTYYAALGHKGQRIYVFPALGVTAAVVASLPTSDERALHQAVVSAIAASTANAPTTADPTDAELEALVRAGFHGSTQVRQSVQDTPRRP